MRETQAQIEAARAVLVEPEPRHSPVPTLAAAALAATAAVLLAGVMILGPGVTIEDPAPASATF